MKLRFKKLDENAKAPTYGTEFSAGADLYALSSEKTEIKPSETKFIGTGLSLEIPRGYVGLVYARSGLSCKRGLAPANKVGVIDSDYRGEITVALYNQSKEVQTLDAHERIAQIVVTPYITCDFEEAETLEDTVRGEGGFGSTGK